MRPGPSLNSDVGQREERMQRVAVNVFQHRNADGLQGERLESNQSRETIAVDDSNRIGRQVQMLEKRHRWPEESRDEGEPIAGQVEIPQVAEADHQIGRDVVGRPAVERVGRHIQSDQRR